MTELWQLWGLDKLHTTSYHPQVSGMVEQNNGGFGDSLQIMLSEREQDEGTYCCQNCKGNIE